MAKQRFMFCNSLIYMKILIDLFLESLSPKNKKWKTGSFHTGAQEYFEYLELCNAIKHAYLHLCMGRRSKVSHNGLSTHVLVYFFHAVKHFCMCNTKYWFDIPTVWSKLVSIAGTSDIHIQWKWYHEPGCPYSNCIPSLTELIDTLNNQNRYTDMLSYINNLFYLAPSYRHGPVPGANLMTIGSSRWLKAMFPYRRKWSFKEKLAKSHTAETLHIVWTDMKLSLNRCSEVLSKV